MLPLHRILHKSIQLTLTRTYNFLSIVAIYADSDFPCLEAQISSLFSEGNRQLPYYLGRPSPYHPLDSITHCGQPTDYFLDSRQTYSDLWATRSNHRAHQDNTPGIDRSLSSGWPFSAWSQRSFEDRLGPYPAWRLSSRHVHLVTGALTILLEPSIDEALLRIRQL